MQILSLKFIEELKSRRNSLLHIRCQIFNIIFVKSIGIYFFLYVYHYNAWTH